MRNAKKLAANSGFYAQIERISMTESKRAEALAALRIADAFVDGVVWVVSGIKRLFAGTAPKTSFGHRLAA